MTRLDEYLAYLDKYSSEYGPKTTILYQCGKFFEIYGVDNNNEKLGQVYEIANLLNFQVTRQDKSIAENSRQNPLMSGFPLSSVDNNVKILLEHGYTVVLVEQVTPPPNPKREVTYIYSPSTYIETSLSRNDPDSNYLVAIILKVCRTNKNTLRIKPKYQAGLVAQDLSTGKPAILYELLETDGRDSNYVLDEIYRFTKTFNPCEFIIYHNLDDNIWSNLHENLDLGDILIHNKHLDDLPSDYTKVAFQNTYLSRYFKDTGHLTPVEFLNLEWNVYLQPVYILMLEFVHSHNPTLLHNISRPTIWDIDRHLSLDNNAISQLNLDGKQSLLKIINKCITPMGRRKLKWRLLNPIRDRDKLECRYRLTEYFMQKVSDKEFGKLIQNDTTGEIYRYEIYRHYLKGILDLERLVNKLEIGLLQPPDFVRLDQTLNKIMYIFENYISTENEPFLNDLYTHNDNKGSTKYEKMLHDFKGLISFYQSVLNLELANKYNLNQIENTIFNKGIYPEIDAIWQDIDKSTMVIDLLEKKLSMAILKGGKVRNTDKKLVTVKIGETGYESHISISKVRYEHLKKALRSGLEIQPGVVLNNSSFQVDTRNKSNVKMTCDLLYTQTENIICKRGEIAKLVRDKYLDLLDEIQKKYSKVFKTVSYTVSMLDLYSTLAMNCLKYGYCRPTICDNDDNVSWLDATGLRHAIIERLDNVTSYVPHNIHLGRYPDQSGMLLFGVNSSGKSSTMKAVGLAIIMAQAGCPVPADSFTFKPYNKICTRIIGNDNLFRGLSSFAVEMNELRGILHRADSKTLVLGDEVCHGTESISAVSIVSASLVHLSKVGASYIFASHLHQLNEIDEVSKLSNLQKYHLKVSYDQVRDCLVYDRNLSPGTGNPIYGLEVAKAMKLPGETLDLADNIRRKLLNTGQNEIVQSRYNSDCYRDSCEICDETASEVHHIRFQEESNSKGKVSKQLDKNNRSNLVALCKLHHDHVHHGDKNGRHLTIFGYVADTGYKGYRLHYEYRIIKPSLLLNPDPDKPIYTDCVNRNAN